MLTTEIDRLNAQLSSARSIVPTIISTDERRAIDAARWRRAVAQRTVRGTVRP